MSPRKFARRIKNQSDPERESLASNSLCRSCALSRAGTPCTPPDFYTQKDCRILAAHQKGYSKFPFMVIDASDYRVRIANSATGIRVPVRQITCFELSHQRSTPCSNCSYICPMDDVKRTGQPVTTQHHHYHGSKEKQSYEVHAHPVFDSKGDVIQIIEYAFPANELSHNEGPPGPISEYLLPLVRTLTSRTGQVEPDYVERLANCLDSDLPQPRDKGLQTEVDTLNPDELSICKMMYHDLSSREMALLSGKNLSQINNKRRRIRQKLGLAQSPVNLNHYLQTRW